MVDIGDVLAYVQRKHVYIAIQANNICKTCQLQEPYMAQNGPFYLHSLTRNSLTFAVFNFFLIFYCGFGKLRGRPFTGECTQVFL